MLTASADATLRLCEPLEQAYGMPHSAVSQRGSSMGFESPNMGTNVAVSTSAGRVRDATDVCSAVAVRATAARTCVPQARMMRMSHSRSRTCRRLVLRSFVPIAARACACSFCTRCFEGHDDWVRGVIAHPDGTMLASCSSDHVRVLGRTAPHLTCGVGRPTGAQPGGVEPQACASVPCQCWVGCADDPSVERCGWRMCQHVPRARPRGRGDRLLGPPIGRDRHHTMTLHDEAAQQRAVDAWLLQSPAGLPVAEDAHRRTHGRPFPFDCAFLALGPSGGANGRPVWRRAAAWSDTVRRLRCIAPAASSAVCVANAAIIRRWGISAACSQNSSANAVMAPMTRELVSKTRRKAREHTFRAHAASHPHMHPAHARCTASTRAG